MQEVREANEGYGGRETRQELKARFYEASEGLKHDGIG